MTNFIFRTILKKWLIKIYCRECENALTPELLEIPKMNLCWDENKDIMPKNKFSIFTNEQSDKKSIMVAIDNYNFERHKLPNSYGFGKIMELNNAAALSMQAGKLKPFMWILYVHRTFSRFGESNEE